MRITFKDVGQGDSILIEWESSGKKKIAIIDCNKKGKSNPVLEHIIKEGYYEIELLVLSHPHRDHFSGLLGLLRYVEKNDIIIKKFAHTLQWSANNFWKYFESSSSSSRLLNKTISKWSELNKKNIRRIHGLQDNVNWVLDDEIGLSVKFLSPSHNDAQDYQKIVENDADKNIKEASQAANHLSTVILFSIDEVNILFTADAEAAALQNVIEQYSELFSEKEFHLCQIPHHGAYNNLCIDFWKIVKTNNGACKHAIASAGEHRTYNHPSFEVLKHFHNEGYDVHCTNILNGMKEYTDYLESITQASLNFDGGSMIAEEYKQSSDRIFEIKGNKIILL